MDNKVTQKVWGWSEAQVVSPLCEVHRIDVRLGGFCSVHKHDRKHNVFTLVRGKMAIYIWEPENTNYEGAPTHIITLKDPGDSLDVAPGIVHQFHALAASMVIETYYPAGTSPEDIRRFTEGGLPE